MKRTYYIKGKPIRMTVDEWLISIGENPKERYTAEEVRAAGTPKKPRSGKR